MELALATHISFNDWCNAEPEAVLTAIEVLNEQAREQKRQMARARMR